MEILEALVERLSILWLGKWELQVSPRVIAPSAQHTMAQDVTPRQSATLEGEILA